VFLVDTLPPGCGEMEGAGFVRVEDTLEALHCLAKWRRESFRGKVIAVTGSTGKTIVKEWLASTLSLAKSVIRSPKSYNSQVGVALSLMNLEDQYEIAVIEAGISRPGEMERLARIIRPDTVIITNIGEAHGENFEGRKAIAAEKLLLTEGADLVICCADDELIGREMAASHPEIPLYTWSLSGKNAALAVKASDTEDNADFKLHNSGSLVCSCHSICRSGVHRERCLCHRMLPGREDTCRDYSQGNGGAAGGGYADGGEAGQERVYPHRGLL
jgi:UDP-N-acetylmuramyl pentapeptide synthase